MTDHAPDATSTAGFDEDAISNPNIVETIEGVAARRFSRRTVIGSFTAIAASIMMKLGCGRQASEPDVGGSTSTSTLTFAELAHGLDDQIHVAAGYQMQVLVRWGDSITASARPFDPHQQRAESQLEQFGYNCDYIAFLPLPRGSSSSSHGLLCVNHEYTNSNLMFPGITNDVELKNMSRELVDVELAAHGHSILEVVREAGRWSIRSNSKFNRRLTTSETRMKISGPAAGHDRLKTSADPTGLEVLGTVNNCSGGVTPWGTLLICEENFNMYFGGNPEQTSEVNHQKRYGIGRPSRFNSTWSRYYDRFHIEIEPNEPNRFGWVVEFDPYDPQSVPVKRTALGRFKHEGAGIVVNHDNRIVIYGGDDEWFEYVYKFVTRDPFRAGDAKANTDLLDDGTLYVAKFHDDGTAEWLPLIHGEGPLTSENGFHSQADVMVETRRAADLLGATAMDRPEAVQCSPVTDHVFVTLTGNHLRTADQVNSANPRAPNHAGHILEMIPPVTASGVDHAATKFNWEFFLRAGNPADPDLDCEYHPETTSDGWFICPDNSVFDRQGRMWIATDSMAIASEFANGVYACDTVGEGRALTRHFFRGPRGAEASGLCLTPDNKTLFVSVQHPGEEPGSDFANPSIRWPDFAADQPPRPSVVAITRPGSQIGV